MPDSRVCSIRLLVVATGATGCFALATTATAQDFGSFFRGDEVGRREVDLDEETFLNILSFRQPLETVQPFLAADSGWQAAAGSLFANTLWLDQDLKYKATVTDTFAVRGLAHQGVDLDTDFTQIQLLPERQFGTHWYVGIPMVLAVDKGSIDGGLATTWRDPAAGIDFAKLSWVRSGLVFEHRSDRFPASTVERAADTFELQLQADLLGFGKTTLIVADEAPSRFRFVETQELQEFSRIHARLLQSVEWNPRQRGFFEAEYEAASEQLSPLSSTAAHGAYEGDRDLFMGRAEYQHDVDDEHLRRWRFGAEYLNYREDAEAPAAQGERARDDTELRAEAIGYAGYRMPLSDSKDVDLETVVYLANVHGQHRSRIVGGDRSDYPDFQGKLSLYFRWHVTDRADFVMSPSFELDTIGWGGGALMLRCRL